MQYGHCQGGHCQPLGGKHRQRPAAAAGKAAEQTGGSISIKSRQKELHPEDHGICVTAEFFKNHIDFTPLGDIVSTLTTLIQGSPEIDFYFLHTTQDRKVSLNTPELREVLGEDVPLNCFEVIQWIAQNLREQYGDQI